MSIAAKNEWCNLCMEKHIEGLHTYKNQPKPMKETFTKISTKINPDKADWYDTDKGRLFWYKSETVWSCRDDEASEEYPKFWYEPLSPPKDVSDEMIHAKALEIFPVSMQSERSRAGEYDANNYEREALVHFAKWMRSQLAGKQPDREFIIQKMDDLVNDLFCNSNENWMRTHLKRNPNSNSIAQYINDWADKNLMEGKESDAIQFAEWINEEEWIRDPFPRTDFNDDVIRWTDIAKMNDIDDIMTLHTTESLYKLFKTETR